MIFIFQKGLAIRTLSGHGNNFVRTPESTLGGKPGPRRIGTMENAIEKETESLFLFSSVLSSFVLSSLITDWCVSVDLQTHGFSVVDHADLILILVHL
jgi:hypothetical protein